MKSHTKSSPAKGSGAPDLARLRRMVTVMATVDPRRTDLEMVLDAFDRDRDAREAIQRSCAQPGFDTVIDMERPHPENRIVAIILERRAQPAFASALVPFVAPEMLLDIARRAGEKIERIGGASVEIYTPLGWLRIYESRVCKPDEIAFGLEPGTR